jgi:hypothetical protein
MEELPSSNVTGESSCVLRHPSGAFWRQRTHADLIQKHILLHRHWWRSVEANLTEDLIELSDRWLGSTADITRLRLAGMKLVGGGPHQSKTMMLAELSTLLSLGEQDDAVDAILHRNVLGKPSMRSRQAALYRLRQLYGIGQPDPICAVLYELWHRDPSGRPLLAILCALARDPLLRDGADAVLDAAPGEQVRWPLIAAAFERRNPGRLGEKMLRSMAQNSASSWTQSGHLSGATQKRRVRAQPTPIVAAYAALLANLAGFGGPMLLESRWLDVVDRPMEDRLSLLRQAEGLGLARVRAAGDVLEIDVAGPMANLLGVPSLVNS